MHFPIDFPFDFKVTFPAKNPYWAQKTNTFKERAFAWKLFHWITFRLPKSMFPKINRIKNSIFERAFFAFLGKKILVFPFVIIIFVHFNFFLGEKCFVNGFRFRNYSLIWSGGKITFSISLKHNEIDEAIF
jgi:hypothetical protein